MKIVTRYLLLVICLLLLANISYADDTAINKLRDNTLSYFTPLKGKITSINGKIATIDLGTKSHIKPGMRVTVFREGAPFIHPVTKEPLGRVETHVGRAEVREVGPDTSALVILKGDVREGDKVRISETKVRMLFYQGKGVDWYLSDSYYRSLKETGRFELVDTAMETDDDARIIAEAKRLNADAVLILSAKESGKDTLLKQRLFWVDDSMKFAEDEINVAVAFVKELKFGEEFFSPQKGDVWLYFDLPFGVRFIATGDLDGDGKQELLMSTGKDVRVYVPGVDLQPSLGGVEIKGSATDDHLWLDTIDLNGNGRDEVIVTSMKDGDVVSYIYELKGPEFSLLWKGKFFLRRIGNELIAQEYDPGQGFIGDVFNIVWNGEYKKGSNVKLPKGVNIYDYVYIGEPGGGRSVLAYDDTGYLNLYDDRSIKIWRSKEDYGGFLTTFKRTAPTVMVERGEWAIKDRLFLRNREALIVKRIPIVGMARGIGYKSSQIKNLWWTGLSMEEGTLIDNINGGILDYALAGDKLIVLSRPPFGIKPKNILKGENPLGSVLYIYSLKGR